MERTRRKINPYKLFLGSFIPNWLLCRTEISQGAKLCYARLCQFAGEDGNCFPKQETLAAEIGVSRRMVGTYLKELKECGLIGAEREGMGKSNRYFFYAHSWMSSQQSGNNASQMEGTEVPNGGEQSFPTTNRKENQERESDKTTMPPSGGGGSGSMALPFSPEEQAVKPNDFGKRVVTIWNATTPKRFVKVRDVEGRAKLVKARLKDPFWVQNWKEALELACQIPALAKGVDWNAKRKWKPNFEWFCRPDTVAKIMEGDLGKPQRKRKTGYKEARVEDPRGGYVSKQVADNGESQPEQIVPEMMESFFKEFKEASKGGHK